MHDDEGRLMAEFTSLTGSWTGVYDYAAGYGEPVSFNALLVEEAGAVSGETMEPNTFAAEGVDCLLATISGARADGQLSFLKRYEGLPGAGHEVRYDGVVNEDLTKIEGQWRIERSGWSGPFVMNRGASAQDAADSETGSLMEQAVAISGPARPPQTKPRP